MNNLSNNSKKYLETFFAIFEDMKIDMSIVKPYSSISATFINQMIPHHLAAIKMSENILKYTIDIAIEQLCINIIEMQTKEIHKMKYILKNCFLIENTSEHVVVYQKNFLRQFDIMIAKMENSLRENNINMDFLSEMIPHHECAIEMAKNALQFHICNDLKNIAEKIVTNQLQQLKLMQILFDQMQTKKKFRYC